MAIGLATANAATSVPSLAYAVCGTTLPLGPILATWIVPMVASTVAAAALVREGGFLPSADHVGGLVSRACAFFLVYALAWLVIPGGLTMLRVLRSQMGSSATPMKGGLA